MGEVIPFPSPLPFDRKRSCFECKAYAAAISFCVETGEQIDSEYFAAADCETYDPEDT